MAPRLAHRKSRKGCRRCKDRKVKCTEEHPSCAACLRHGVPCHYGGEDDRASSRDRRRQGSLFSTEGTSSNLASENRESSQSTASPPIVLETPYASATASQPGLPDQLRQAVELYLIHQFKSSVAATFPSAQTPELDDMYSFYAVEYAFDHPNLLNAIFSITTLYLSVTQSTPAETGKGPTVPQAFRSVNFAHLHCFYLNAAISQQREAVATLGPSNADAVGLATSILSVIANCLLASPAASSPDAEYSPPVQQMRLSSSTLHVLDMSVRYLQDGVMSRYSKVSRSRPNFTDRHALFDPSNAAPFAKILEFTDPASLSFDPPDTDPEVSQTYTSVLAYVGSMFAAVLRDVPNYHLCMMASAFGTIAPKSYVPLLAQKRPRALVIFATYMAMVKCVDNYWFFRGRAEKEILGIQSILPPEWQWALRWPLAVLKTPDNIKTAPVSFDSFDSPP